MTEPINPQTHLARMEHNAPRLAKARAERVYLEEFRKTRKAQLMAQSTENSAAMKEADAYRDPDYIQVLDGLKVAVEAEELLRWRMVTDQAAIEVWRSQESSNRAMDRGTR